MKIRSALGLAVPVVSVLIAFDAVAATKPITLALKLAKKPPYAAPAVPALLAAGPVSLVVEDARTGDDLSVVGVQQEKGNALYFWKSAQPVAPSVAKMAAEVLTGWSVRVAEGAPVTLKLSMTSFFVTEKSVTFGSTYVADVRFQATLVDQTGASIWSGSASGASKWPGLDARASEANSAFSSALREALASLVGAVKLESTPQAPSRSPAQAEITMAITSEQVLTVLTRLKTAGATDDALVEYVQGHKPSRPLNVEEILQWKNAGVPDAAIKAATK